MARMLSESEVTGDAGSGDAGSGDTGSGALGDLGSGADGPVSPPLPPTLPPPTLPPVPPTSPPSLPPLSPPQPPSHPPSPQAPPSAPVTHEVLTFLTVAGSVDDFDENATSALASTFAAEANVSDDRVTVTVSSASVLLTVAIATSSEEQSSTITSALSTALADASSASAFLASAVPGIFVEAAPVVAAYSVDGCRPGLLDLGSVQCVSCPPGYACGYNTTLGTLAAAVCPAGFYCPAGSSTPTPPASGQHAPSSGLALPIPCSPGTYSAVSSSLGTQSCSACPAGHSCAAAGTAAPLQCPAGTYGDPAAGSVACTPCAIGTFSAAVAATSAATCEACGGGLTSAAGSASPSMCVTDPLQAEAEAASGTAAIVFIALGMLLGGAALLLVWSCLPRKLAEARVEAHLDRAAAATGGRRPGRELRQKV